MSRQKPEHRYDRRHWFRARLFKAAAEMPIEEWPELTDQFRTEVMRRAGLTDTDRESEVIGTIKPEGSESHAAS